MYGLVAFGRQLIVSIFLFPLKSIADESKEEHVDEKTGQVLIINRVQLLLAVSQLVFFFLWRHPIFYEYDKQSPLFFS